MWLKRGIYSVAAIAALVLGQGCSAPRSQPAPAAAVRLRAAHAHRTRPRPEQERPAHERPAHARPAGARAAPGNPAGHAVVPPAGRAVSTSHPSRVIGNGTPASCTSAAVARAVAAGGVITFSCGSAPLTILMSSAAKVRNTSTQVVIDVGGKITLSGN